MEKITEHGKRRTWNTGRRLAALVLAAGLMLTAGCSGGGSSSGQSGSEEEPVPDTVPPRLMGVQDLTVAMNGTVSYRDGVSAEDDVDGPVAVQIDAAAVDLTAPGEYPVVYSAQDAAGNRTEWTAIVTVVETVTVDQGADEPTEDVTPSNGGGSSPDQVTQEDVDQLCDQILGKIIRSDMSQRDQAKAIFDYVNRHIKYVGSSDKSSWIIGAYVGFTRGRGDCYNYFACSKALLTRAGIPNINLTRVGGNSRHYWQLVNTGDGWYHFDACPHPTGYPLVSFMITETQARTYTEQVKRARKNYYVYDYESCTVQVEGMPPEGWKPPVSAPPAVTQPPAEEENPGEGENPGGENPVIPPDPAGSQEPGTGDPIQVQDPITGEWSGGDPAVPDQSGAGGDPVGGGDPAQTPPDRSGEGSDQLAA